MLKTYIWDLDGTLLDSYAVLSGGFLRRAHGGGKCYQAAAGPAGGGERKAGSGFPGLRRLSPEPRR